MADKPDLPPYGLPAGFVHVANAPFVYFDGPSCVGVLNGIVQIELAAKYLLPLANGEVEGRTVDVARLRCSVAAAMALKGDLERAIQLASQANESPPASVARVN